MKHRKPVGIYPQWRTSVPLCIPFSLAAMVAIAALPLLLLAALLPPPLVLPTLCLIAVAGAGILSFVAWRNGTARDSQSVTTWDVAGALTFVGCAAAMLSNPDHVIQLAEPITRLSEIR